MKIMVSACLAGENCKYNGGNNQNEKVLQLMRKNEVIVVCPEAASSCRDQRWCCHSQRRTDRGCGVPHRRCKMSGDRAP